MGSINIANSVSTEVKLKSKKGKQLKYLKNTLEKIS